MLLHMSSDELSGWAVLLQVQADEQEYRQHLAESGDGEVIVTGRDDDIDDEEEDPYGSPD